MIERRSGKPEVGVVVARKPWVEDSRARYIVAQVGKGKGFVVGLLNKTFSNHVV